MGKIRSTNSEAHRAVYTVDSAIDGVLDNWGRWSAPRHGVARSTNAMFRMVKPSYSRSDAAMPIAVPVDVDSAWLAERVVCNPGFYPRARTLLANHYVFGIDQRQTCRLLGLHRNDYDAELWRSSYIFWNQYERRAPAS